MQNCKSTASCCNLPKHMSFPTIPFLTAYKWFSLCERSEQYFIFSYSNLGRVVKIMNKKYDFWCSNLVFEFEDLQFYICSYNLLSKSIPPFPYKVMICNNISDSKKQTHFLFAHNLSKKILLFRS